MAAVLWIVSVAQAEDARVPYAFVYKILETQERLSRSYTNLQVVVRMKSSNPAVKIDDLSVVLESKTQKTPVTLGSDGRFTLPIKQDWLLDDAWLVVNQPKGTMLLDWHVGLSGASITNQMHYAELMRPVSDLDPVQAEMVRAFPSAPRLTVDGMKLIFPEGKESLVVIRAKGGERTLKPDEHHIVIIPLETGLMVENPEVWIPILPEKADVEFRKNGK